MLARNGGGMSRPLRAPPDPEFTSTDWFLINGRIFLGKSNRNYSLTLSSAEHNNK